MTLTELKEKLEEATESTWSWNIDGNALLDILSSDSYANKVRDTLHNIDPQGGWSTTVIDGKLPVVVVYKERKNKSLTND